MLDALVTRSYPDAVFIYPSYTWNHDFEKIWPMLTQISNSVDASKSLTGKTQKTSLKRWNTKTFVPFLQITIPVHCTIWDWWSGLIYLCNDFRSPVAAWQIAISTLTRLSISLVIWSFTVRTMGSSWGFMFICCNNISGKSVEFNTLCYLTKTDWLEKLSSSSQLQSHLNPSQE